MILRAAQREELPMLLEIYNQVILYTTAVYEYQPHTLEMRQAWFDTKMTQGLPVIVAEDQGEILGFASYGPFRAWAAYQYTVEHSVYVKESQRGRGIGRMLLEEVIRLAKNAGMHTLIAGIDASNETSIALHAKLGFKSVALFAEVGWKFDRWLDLNFMQLMLQQH